MVLGNSGPKATGSGCHCGLEGGSIVYMESTPYLSSARVRAVHFCKGDPHLVLVGLCLCQLLPPLSLRLLPGVNSLGLLHRLSGGWLLLPVSLVLPQPPGTVSLALLLLLGTHLFLLLLLCSPLFSLGANLSRSAGVVPAAATN